MTLRVTVAANLWMAPAADEGGMSEAQWDQYQEVRSRYPNLSYVEYAKNPAQYASPTHAASPSTVRTDKVRQRVVGDRVPADYRTEFASQYRELREALRQGKLEQVPDATIRGFTENAARILAEEVLPSLPSSSLKAPGSLQYGDAFIVMETPGVYSLRASLPAEEAIIFFKSGKLPCLSDSKWPHIEIPQLEKNAMQALIDAAETDRGKNFAARSADFRELTQKVIRHRSIVKTGRTSSYVVASPQKATPRAATRPHGIGETLAHMLRRIGWKK